MRNLFRILLGVAVFCALSTGADGSNYSPGEEVALAFEGGDGGTDIVLEAVPMFAHLPMVVVAPKPKAFVVGRSFRSMAGVSGRVLARANSPPECSPYRA